MSFGLCSSWAIIRKAGANASSTATASSALLAEFYDEALASINSFTRKDWTDGTIGTAFSDILTDTISDLAGMKVITYDMSGYTSRLEAQTMLDVMRDNVIRNLDVLKDEKHKEVIS